MAQFRTHIFSFYLLQSYQELLFESRHVLKLLPIPANTCYQSNSNQRSHPKYGVKIEILISENSKYFLMTFDFDDNYVFTRALTNKCLNTL